MSARLMEDDSYEDWKQIDGFFASMGQDGELSEESVLMFLRRDDGLQYSNVGPWLSSFGLGFYENVLIANGFDNLNMLNGGVLEESELQLMGFTDTNHINTLLAQISRLPVAIKPLNPKNLPLSVDEWLTSLDLTSYINKFHELDYATMERVMQMWEVDLAVVLGVVLLGHQKRILTSLGNNRPGFEGRNRKEGVSDISQVVKVTDIKMDTPSHEYFKFMANGHKKNTAVDSLSTTSSASAISESSDSGCSSEASPPPLPKKTQAAYKSLDRKVASKSLDRKAGSGHLDMADRAPRHPPSLSSIDPETKASFERSQSAKQITKSATETQNKLQQMMTGPRTKGQRKGLKTPTDFNGEADYALVGDLEGLKFSKTRRILEKAKSKSGRPLPSLPRGERLTFTVKDLPKGFRGKHDPKILIEGAINYSACYLGTCLVGDDERPSATREAIARMKAATQTVTKLPIVALSISFKGVGFIDSSSQRGICDHEITNIYCAAQDNSSMNYFAYMTKDFLSHGLYCHVFCVKSEDLARQIILTLGEAFEIAHYAIQKHPCLLEPDVWWPF